MRSSTTLASFGALLCALAVFACAESTSPNDSTVAPTKGSRLEFASYVLDTRTRTRDLTKNVAEVRDTVVRDTGKYWGRDGVFAFYCPGSHHPFVVNDTVYMAYEDNGDVSMYRGQITLGSEIVLGQWLRLPVGSRVGETVVALDTTIRGQSGDSVRAQWECKFEGPEAVALFELLPAQLVNALRIHVTETVAFYELNNIHQVVSSSVYTNDALLWYAPEYGYFVNENALLSSTFSNTVVGYGRTLASLPNF